MKKIIFTVLSVFLLNAETLESNLEHWENVTSERSDIMIFLSEIENGTKWVKVQSAYTRGNKELPNFEERKSDLFLKLKKSVSEFSGDTENTNLNLIESLFKLESELYDAGGYDNKVLGLSVAKIAGVHMLHLGLKDKAMLSKLANELKRRNERVLFAPTKSLVKFSMEDEQFKDSTDTLKRVVETEDTKQKLSYGHVGLIVALNEQLPTELRRKEDFLNQGIYITPSVFHLEAFESSIESYLRSTLPFAMDFLSKGGVLHDLDPNKVTEINEIMGEEKWRYKFPYLQISYPTSQQLVNAYNEVKNDDLIIKQLHLE